jgi:2-keto-4-pentenoate hydratase
VVFTRISPARQVGGAIGCPELASCGAALSAGDVVITGSVIPPLDVSGGGAWHVVAPGLGEVSVQLTVTGG